MNNDKTERKGLNMKDWGIVLLIIGIGLMINAKSHPFTKMGGKLVNHSWQTTTIIMKGPEDFMFYMGLVITIIAVIILIYSRKIKQ